jgi:hypothetical protein
MEVSMGVSMTGIRVSITILLAGLGFILAAGAAEADCVSACQASTYCDSDMNASGECGWRLNDCYINQCNRKLYGALAYDADNRDFGWSADFDNQADAERKALSGCSPSSNCKVVYDFWNSCAALAAAGNGDYAIEGGDDRQGAESRALAACRADGSEGCEIQVWGCTGN